MPKFTPLGTAKSPRDARDHRLSSYAIIRSGSALPDEVGTENMRFAPRIRDQKWEGSCTGHGGRTVKAVTEARSRRRRLPEFGPRGIYNLAKEVGGYPDEEGAYLRDVCKALTRHGTPLERDWPYCSKHDETGTHNIGKPRKDFAANAQRFRIGAYAQTRTISEMLTGLHTCGPLLMGTAWFEEWFYPNPDGTLPKAVTDAGAHCTAIMLAVQSEKRMLCANSWGEGYGKDGYFWISYDQFFSDGYHESWVIPDAADQR